jgi:hypothetical protein
MTAMEPFCALIGINTKKFSKIENILIEIELFIRIYDELKEFFRTQYRDFFDLMKFTQTKENIMLENNFIKLLLNDILTTQEYTLEGIAYYTNIPQDVVQELASGLNTKPIINYLRKVIELHRLVRGDLYQAIKKKIISEL